MHSPREAYSACQTAHLSLPTPSPQSRSIPSDMRQAAIYTYIVSCIRACGCPPSYREIGDAVGITATSHIHYYLTRLELRGLIIRQPNKRRSIQLPPSAATAPLGPHGIFAEGEPLTLNTIVLPGIPLVLRLRGNSLRDAQLCDGDKLLVQPGAAPHDGDLVIVEQWQRGGRGPASLRRFSCPPTHGASLDTLCPTQVPLCLSNDQWQHEWHVWGAVTTLVRPC